MHSILHDWADDKSGVILTQLKNAMKKGYSRILIDDVVIPEKGAGVIETGSDFLMMVSCAGKERVEREWRELIESVEGLKVERVVNYPGGGIIEAVLT